jgi:hypothetical protein
MTIMFRIKRIAPMGNSNSGYYLRLKRLLRK